MIRVKICGVRQPEDVTIAARCGADAFGVLVGRAHHSPDFIESAEARRIIRTAPPFMTPVLVTHLSDPVEVLGLINATGVNVVQIHSEMDPTALKMLRGTKRGLRVLKAFHIISEESVTYGEPYLGCVDGFILDTFSPETDQVGGTGRVHDWHISRAVVERYAPMPVILAGGLDPVNVSDAVKAVRPYGVDVNTGTKNSGGMKDEMKIKNFIKNAKAASYSNN